MRPQIPPRSECDAVIVGGGPAGLAAAIAARMRGLKVVVADAARIPVHKACGEGLMPDGVQALRQLGVVLGAGEFRPFVGIRFVDGGVSAQGRFASAAGAGVRRAVLHRRLVRRAAEVGVEIHWGCPVKSFSGGCLRIGDRTLRPRWLVGADGLHSRVRRWAGLERGWSAQPRIGTRIHYRVEPWTDLVEVHWRQHCQAYVTPVAADEICVALMTNRDAPERIEDLSALFPTLAARLRGAQPSDSVRGAASLTRKLRAVASGRVVLIGDAAGSVDAITGQGLSMALRQALVLGEALARGDLAPYAAAHRRITRTPRMMARMLLILDGRPHLRHAALRALAARPALFSRLLAAHVGAINPPVMIRDLAGLTARTLVMGAAARVACL